MFLLEREVVAKDSISKKIFVVHGDDDVMFFEVARTIERLELELIILHEQDDKGVSSYYWS